MSAVRLRNSAALAALVLIVDVVAATSSAARVVPSGVINDPSGDYSKPCRDIVKVVPNVTATTVKFAVTMHGTTCSGHGIPLIQIDADKNGTDECQAIAFNGPSDIRCDGKVKGTYTAKPSPSHPKVWQLSFPRDALGTKRSVLYSVVTWTNANAYADAAPDNGDITLRLN